MRRRDPSDSLRPQGEDGGVRGTCPGSRESAKHLSLCAPGTVAAGHTAGGCVRAYCVAADSSAGYSTADSKSAVCKVTNYLRCAHERGRVRTQARPHGESESSNREVWGRKGGSVSSNPTSGESESSNPYVGESESSNPW